MPVSPTDFYAYAQATGTPVPQNRQEQAQLAPAVFQWRKAQLQNRDSNNRGALGQIAGGIGALGLGATGIYGARKGLQALRNRPTRGIAGIQEIATEAAPTLRKVTTGIETGKTTPTVAIPQQGVKNVVKEIVPVEETVDDITLVSERPSGLTREGTAVNSLQDYLGDQGYIDTSVAAQNAKQPLVSDQSVTAVNSSSNQVLKEFKSDVQVDIDSIANKPLVVQEKLYTAEDLMASSLPQEEIATRISAAAKDWGGTEEMGPYGEIIRTPNTKVPQLLLNPNTPESVIHEYLGTTPQNLGGRQSFVNPTHEVLGGGGVTERPQGVIGYVPAGKTIRHKLSPAERDELGLFSDRSALGNRGYTGTSSDIWTDDVVAGIEGLGGPLTEVEAYQELRRKSGKTMVPGQVMADEALAEGSERLERVLDEAIPLRQYRTAEGTPTSGLIFTDQTTRKPRAMQGVKLAGQTVRTPNTIAYELDAKGKPVRKEVVVDRGERLQAPIEISDPNITGNKIIGNVETQEPTRYFVLGKQPDIRRMDKSGVISTPQIGETISIDILESGRMVPSYINKEGKLQGIYDLDIIDKETGKQTLIGAESLLHPAGKYKAGEDRIAMQPYMMKKEVLGSDGQLYETSVPIYGPLMQRTFDAEGKAQLSPTSVSRYQLKQLANAASQEWDNPLVKRNWMLQNAPGETEAPYHRTTYIAQQLKSQLQKGITTTGPDVPVSRTPSQVAVKTRGTDAGPGILIPGTTQRAQGPIGPSRTVTTGQIDLPVLEDERSGAAARFITDLTDVTKDAQVRGRPIPTSGNVDYKKGKVLVPGATPERKGLGGLDPMQLEDATSEDFVAYQSPRVEMGSARLQQAPAERRVGPQQTLWDIKQARQRSSPASQDSIDTLILNQNELNTKVNQLLAQGKRRAAKGRKS